MKKEHFITKTMAIVFAVINSAFMFVMAFAQGERTNSLVALIVLIFVSLHFLSHYLSRDIFKGSKTHLTITLAITLIASIVFLFTGTNIDTICVIWAIIDLIQCVLNIVVAVIEVKRNKLSIIELVVQAANIVIDILLIIELHEGLTLHLTFCGIEILSSVVIMLIELIQEKKRDNPMLHAHK